MVILFTFWYVLGWQFPAWLWVIAGLFFISYLSNGKKKVSGFFHGELPLTLALGLVYGSLPDGNPILEDGQGWTILFILIGSGILAGGVTFNSSSKSTEKSKEKGKSKEEAENLTLQTEGVAGSKLKIKVIKNGEKTVNISLSLKLVRFFGKFVPAKAEAELNAKGIDLDTIIEEVKNGAEVGVIAEVQDGEDHVFISVE